MAFHRDIILLEKIDLLRRDFLEQLAGIPVDKLTVGVEQARSPLMLAAECACFNDWVAEALNGTIVPLPDPSTRDRYYATADTLEKVREWLDNACTRLLTAFAHLEDDELDHFTISPEGRATTKYKLVDLAYSNMIYRYGQMSYIRTCYGLEEDGFF